MKKLFFIIVCYCFSFSAFANTVNCGHAPPTSSSQFCSSFKTIAYCHCHDEHGMPPVACSDMNRILQMMIAMYGSLWAACSPSAQHDSSQQECVDDWNYYTSNCH